MPRDLGATSHVPTVQPPCMFTLSQACRRQRYGLHRTHISSRRALISSFLDADVLAAAQKMAADAAVEESRKLTTLKVQMPSTDEHIKRLVELNRRSDGLWDTFSCELRIDRPSGSTRVDADGRKWKDAARAGIADKRVFLVYNSHKSALKALDAIRSSNHTLSLQFRAQLWHTREIVHSVQNTPGRALMCTLGYHGTINDVRALFQGWPENLMPENISLGENLRLPARLIS